MKALQRNVEKFEICEKYHLFALPEKFQKKTAWLFATLPNELRSIETNEKDERKGTFIND